MPMTGVYFGILQPPASPRYFASKWRWTLLGAIAIPLWATWPALSLQTRELPPLECLTIIFSFAWVTTKPLERAVLPVEFDPHPWRSWIPAAAFGLAEAGSAGFFLLATRHIPPLRRIFWCTCGQASWCV
jgi:hypothetical protein